MKRVILAKLLLLLPIAGPLQLGPPIPPPTRISGEISQTGEGLIEGLVKRQNGDEPISGVTVILAGGPRSVTDTVGRLTETTDSAGRFLFRNLPPGGYTITLSRDGYFFRRSLSGTLDSGQIVVGPGRSATAVAFSMIQGGTISGRILDPAGRPAVAAAVTAARASYQDSRPILRGQKATSTDDRGDYRLFGLEPGEYLVMAEKNLPSGYTKGYFPGGDDARAAISVTVGEGLESSRTDFSLGNVPASVTVSGTLTVVVPGFETPPSPQSRDSLARPETRSSSGGIPAQQFFLLPLDAGRMYEGPALFSNAVTDSQDRAAGKFELRNVRSGAYELFAVLQDRASSLSKYYAAHSTIDVGAQDLGGVALVLAPGVDLKGTVRAGTGTSTPSVRVSLRPKGILPNWNGTTVVSTDGTFSLPNVSEFLYNISIEPLEPNAYVSELRQGRDSILEHGVVTVSRTLPDTLEAVVETQVATIRGSVMATPSQLAAGIMMTLVPEESRRGNLSLYRRAIAIGGAFSFAGVPPGRYKLYAWEAIPDGAEQNTEFMNAYKDKGVDVIASAGSTSSIEVRLTPK